MPYQLIKTELSQRIADAIARQMKDNHIGAMQLEHMLHGRVNEYAVRRIRQGHSGCNLRTYEELLSVLGLRLAVLPQDHPDILD